MARFAKFNEQILTAGIDVASAKLKVVLVDMDDAGPTAGAWKITDVQESSNPTITTQAAHGLSTGDRIEMFNVGGAEEVNGVWRVASVPTSTTFTITLAIAPTTYTSGGYLADLTQEFLSQFVPSGGRVGTSGALTGVTVANGVLDASDLLSGNKIITTDGSDPVEAFLIVMAAATFAGADLADTAQRLIWICTPNSSGGSGLPITPNSGGVELTWNANGIFDLSAGP